MLRKSIVLPFAFCFMIISVVAGFAEDSSTEQPANTAEQTLQDTAGAPGTEAVQETEASPAVQEESKEVIQEIPAATPEEMPEVIQEKHKESKEKPVKAQQKPVKKKKTNYFDSKSFVAPIDFQMDGKIVGIKEEKTLISQGDVVYLDIGFYNGVEKGTRCDVYRKKEKIRDSSGEIIGYQVIKLGILQLTEDINENSATAVIYRSYEPIVKGDYIKIAK
ncbi:MAG: hypothetical protein A3J83_02945 [Elusimicrobia bacterium RIFOXYA2_FULL_40_6]|nr:MAG: hypothetical protein A3J83_02945 [Elusimicrobia bacterium RIFOXYA2_FULL_40_6]